METENQTAQPVESFQQIISDSKAELAAQAEQQVKRGRGRPPGSKNVKGRENDPKLEDGPAPESSRNFENRPPIDLTPALKDATKIPFTIASVRYKAPELEIDDKEAETPTYYLDRLLNLHLPELEKKDPKAFAFWAWIASMALVAIKKIVVAIEKKKQNQTAHTQSESPTPESNQGPAPSPATEAIPPGRDAGIIFSRGKF